jgi:hypothetical protein
MIGSARAVQSSTIKSASLTMTPSTGSYAINATLTVTLYVNSGGNQINGVEADLSYNASQLQFLSIDTTSSAFNETAQGSGGSGSVSIVRLSTTSLTGSQVVASVSFTVLATASPSPITFSSSCHVIRTSDTRDLWDGVLSGGSYTLT